MSRSRVSSRGIYERVYSAIIQHSLPPGTKLTEDMLAETFDVSRTVIRAVLLRLAHDGIVELRANRGAFVARPSIKQARDVFAARRLVEHGIVRSLGKPIPKTDLERLSKVVRAENEARSRGDGKALIKQSGDFHLALAEIAGNDVLSEILKELISRSSLVVAVFQTPNSAGCRSDDHRRLVNLLARGDISRAAHAMHRHLTEIEKSLRLTEQNGAALDMRSLLALPDSDQTSRIRSRNSSPRQARTAVIRVSPGRKSG